MLPGVTRHNQWAQQHIIRELDLEQGIDKRVSLAPVERPCGENQEIEIGFGVALAAGARAEQHDLNRCETLAQEPRCRPDGRAFLVIKRSLIDRTASGDRSRRQSVRRNGS